MTKFYLLLFAVVFLSSCATVVNRRTVKVNVYSHHDSVKVATNYDSAKWYTAPAIIIVPRSKNALWLTVKKDSAQVLMQVSSLLSKTYTSWNIVSPFLAGYLIDLFNQKRFTYPKSICVDYDKLYVHDNKNSFINRFMDRQADTVAQSKKLLAKFCPLALTDDVSFPTIQGGLEFKLSKKLSWYNEAGIKYLKSYYEKVDTSIIKSKGFKLKSEVRYYIQNLPAHKMEGSYFAANVFFTRDNYNTQLSYSPQSDSSRVYTDVFGVKKNILGINLLFGYQSMFSKRFGFDVYAGLGARFRSINTVGQQININNDRIHGPIDLNIASIRDNLDAEGGKSAAPNFTTSIRLIYKLW